MNVYDQLIRAQLQNASADLTPTATGLVYFNTTAVKPYMYDGVSWKEILLAGSVSALNDTYVGKSADYTVLTNDGYRTIGMTTSTTNRTVTLPAAASSTNRVLTIKKIDSASGKVIIDGNSSETIDGATTYTLYLQYDSITLQCDGTGWVIIDKTLMLATPYIGLGGNGYGSTDTSVRRFTSNTDGTGGVTTAGAGVGQYWTCTVPGRYYVAFRDTRSGSTAFLCITKNSSKLTSGSAPLATDSFVEYYGFALSGLTGEGTCVVECAAGDIIRFQSTSSTTTGDDCRGVIKMISRT